MPTDQQLTLRRPPDDRHRRIGLLSTYPPKLCGLATFAAALAAELDRAGDDVTVIKIEEGSVSTRSRSSLINGSASSVRETAQALSECDIAIVQHEYGIYGGVDGDEVIDVLKAVCAPVIVVLHTVPAQPTAHQRSVLETICDLAARIVVMTEAAGTRLLTGYAVDRPKVVTIPHGASLARVDHRSEPANFRHPSLLTWGLLGPGKGIEHAISAVSLLADDFPRLRYTVAGATHPKVLARDGEQYRRSLMSEARRCGVAKSIRFDDSYRDVASLVRFVASASLVVLPYDSREQVTSGVLVDAIAAGRPVIATAFPHAIELLSDGAGIVVPHRDPTALAEAIRAVVTDYPLFESMVACASALAPSLSWRAVAARYRDLCDALAPSIAVTA